MIEMTQSLKTRIKAKMPLKTTVRLTVILILTAVFLYEGKTALDKLNENRVGTDVTYEPITEAQVPNITICPYFSVQVDGNNMTKMMEKYFEEAKRRVFIALFDTAVVEGQNLLMLPNFEDTGYDINDVFTTSLSMSASRANEVIFCLTYNPPKKEKLGSDNKITFLLRMDSDSQYLSVTLFSQGRTFPSTIRNFGAHNLYPQPPQQITTEYNETHETVTGIENVYEIEMSKRQFLDRTERPCFTDEGDESFSLSIKDCFEKFVEKSLKCRLPWRKKETHGEKLAKCERQGILKEVKDVYSEFRTLTDKQFTVKTGCKPRCSALFYNTKLINSLQNSFVVEKADARAPNVHLQFFFTNPEVKIEREFWAYDENSFLAEMGGFLGLLLGFSFLSLYELLWESGEKVRNKIDSKY